VDAIGARRKQLEHRRTGRKQMSPNQPIPDTAGGPIVNGMTVYGINGEKLGTVRNYDPHVGYLDIQKGWLFHKDFYVPMTTVQSVTGDGLTLQLTHQDLDNDRYTSPPTGGIVYGEGFVITDASPSEKHPVELERDDVTVESTSGGTPLS
jgi:hypothetical protein